MSDSSSEAEGPRRDERDDERDTLDTEAILARRRKFIAAALGALTLGAAEACSPPTPCLEVNPTDTPSRDATDTGIDSAPMPCLTPPFDSGVDTGVDVAPMPCLSPPFDSGVEDAPDAAPTPCLRVIPDGGAEQDVADAAPTPCLRVTPPDGG
jgi:hypothetical protein